MGCVYYKWQLVFADIINIDKLLLCTIMDCTHLTEYNISYDRHMIVQMTRLYTRLVTYAKLYILRLVVFFYHDISYISFITLFLILIILLSFISVIMLLLITLLLCTNTFPFTHTLIRSLLTILDSHVQDFGHLLILFRCSYDRTLRKELKFLSFGSGILITIVFLLFPDS